MTAPRQPTCIRSLAYAEDAPRASESGVVPDGSA